MLILVRHGRTDVNASGRLQGRADPPLDAAGVAQAEALRAVLPERARVISSPLQRARHTAEVVSRGRDVQIDGRWVELDYGEWDGLPLDAVPAGEWARWRSDPSYRPPGGETLVECGARVRLACDELSDLARSEDVIVVSHVSPIKAAVAWALGAGEESSWRMFLGVAAVCRVAVTDRGPSLHSFNELGHLARALPSVSGRDSLR
ncbi:MAG: histidine phosphatase family protein [Acidimicrobiales bacterium]